MPQELRFSTLKENRSNFGNFFPPEVDLDYFFSEEAEEKRRIAGEKTFLEVDEIPDDQIDRSFLSWISECALEPDRCINDEFDDDLLESDYVGEDINYLINKFGDGEKVPTFFIVSQDKTPELGQELAKIIRAGKLVKKDCPRFRFSDDSHGKRGRRPVLEKQFRKSIRNFSF